MAKCTECGAAVADDLKFCGYCGAKLNIVSEHLGTQILGNTQVILDAMERMAPGTVQRYTVLGTASEGPIAGGLILIEPQERGHRYLWSNGEKLTEIGLAHVMAAWERGAFEWQPDLTHTCPSCLTTYHRTRGVGFQRSSTRYAHLYGPSEDGGPLFQAYPLFIDLHKCTECPVCSAVQLDSPSDRGAYFQHQYDDVHGRLQEGMAHIRRDMDQHSRGLSLLKSRYDRQVLEKIRADEKRLVMALETLEWLREPVSRAVESDGNRFHTFAGTLPTTLLDAFTSQAGWQAYQAEFAVVRSVHYVGWIWYTDRNVDYRQIKLTLPPRLAHDAGLFRRLGACMTSGRPHEEAPNALPTTGVPHVLAAPTCESGDERGQ